MSKILEDIKKKAARKTRPEMTKHLLRKGMLPLEDFADVSGCTL